MLRDRVAELESRLGKVQAEKEDWKDKASKLATQFLGTLKELRENLYTVKVEQEAELLEAKMHFE